MERRGHEGDGIGAPGKARPGGIPLDLAERIRALPWAPGGLAAFDADETLWADDAGVGFLEWADRGGRLLAEQRGAFEEYRRLRPRDEGKALALCATAFAGLAAEEVAALAEAHFATRIAPGIFPAMSSLIDWLREAGAAIWVVTASPRFSVLPGTRRLGIPDDRVLGLEVEVEAGRLGARLVGPPTYRAEKARRLVEAAGGPPLLAMGNGSNDRELLEAATGLAVAVDPSEKPRSDGGPSLADAARRLGWPVLRLQS